MDDGGRDDHTSLGRLWQAFSVYFARYGLIEALGSEFRGVDRHAEILEEELVWLSLHENELNG